MPTSGDWEWLIEHERDLSENCVSDRLVEKLRNSPSEDTLRLLIRRAYRRGLKSKLGQDKVTGRVPSGLPLSSALLFIDVPIIWMRDFSSEEEMVLNLLRWELVPPERIEEIWSDPYEKRAVMKIQEGGISPDTVSRLLLRKNVEKTIEIAVETYKELQGRCRLIIAATGRPEMYSQNEALRSFLVKIAEIQGTVPFGGLRNSAIAAAIAGEEQYKRLIDEKVRQFGGDYYAAFRYAKIKSLASLEPLSKPTETLLETAESPSEVKELYMSVYSSIYGSLMGVHPILGGKELHPDEKSRAIEDTGLQDAFNAFPGAGLSRSIGPIAFQIKRRIELPRISIQDALRYGDVLKKPYERIYSTLKGDTLEIEAVRDYVEDELQYVGRELRERIGVEDAVSEITSAVGVAFQLFSHQNPGMFETLASLAPMLFWLLVYYRLRKKKRTLAELLRTLEEKEPIVIPTLLIY
jgi:hypothetical protein